MSNAPAKRAVGCSVAKARGIPSQWLDRDYVGLTLAASTGSINQVPYAYGAHWGMPAEVGEVRIPAADLPADVTLFAEGAKPGSRGASVPARIEDGSLVLTVTPALSGRWIYVVGLQSKT